MEIYRNAECDKRKTKNKTKIYKNNIICIAVAYQAPPQTVIKTRKYCQISRTNNTGNLSLDT